ncbi:MAG: NAD(P)/FAD-dependent oxidoreductase [Candidatus Omnitrophota bacterium]
MVYDCLVIGAGIGGLAAALKLSAEGKRVLLLERQPVPGGLATSFMRKGFTFESSLHCADGLEPGGAVREFLDDCGITKGLELITLDNFMRLIYPQHELVVDFNRQHFIDYLKINFAQDVKKIDRLFAYCDKFYCQFERFANSGLPEGLVLLLTPFLYPSMVRVSGMTTEELLGRYIHDAKLKGMIADIWKFIGLPPKRLSALYFLIVFRGYYLQHTCFVKGGFAKLFQAIVEKIKENGSEVKFNTTVRKISAAGLSVITDKDELFQAKAIISNANPIDTLTKLIDSPDINEEYLAKLSGMEKSLSCVQVYLGLSIPAKSLGMQQFMSSISNTYDQEENFSYFMRGDYENCSLNLVDHAQIDPGLVPPGKGSLLIMCGDNYAHWANLNAEDYARKKKETADILIRRAENYLPGLSGHIEVMEVGTPRTVERFGSVPEGAIYGFAQSVKQSGINRLGVKSRVNGLFLAGAWVFPGAGLHACFVSGQEAADAVLKFLRRR